MPVKNIYLVNFLDTVGMAFTLPLLNPHILSLGGSLSLVGIINSLFSGAQLFSSPIVGSWSDTRGRKLLLVITLSIVFISNMLTAFSSIPLFFLARILYGIGHHTDALLRALIADTVPEEELTNTFNKLMATAGLAFIFGPVIGGALYQFFGKFVYITVILCILDLLTIGTAIYFIEEKSKKKESQDKQTNTSFIQGISADLSKVFADLLNVNWTKYGDLLAIKFFCEASFSLVFMNMGLVLMKRFEFSQTQMGLSIAYISITMIISTFIASFIIQNVYKSDKSGYQRIQHGFVTLAVSFCTMFFTDTPVLYLSVFIPLCAAKQLLDSTWLQILSSRTTESDKGVMMGAASSMLSLSGLICPLVGGVVGDFFGIKALIGLPLVPAITGIVLVRKAISGTVSTVNEKKD